MEHIIVDGVKLEVDIRGSTAPVVFIHGSILADAFVPLLAEPAIKEHYRVIKYHRRGFAGSDRTNGPISVARQAADCRVILKQLGIERAHIVGHSYGGVIALQLALDAPSKIGRASCRERV